MDDNSIIDLYWERSESAISETAQKYGNYCTTIALNILHNKEDADECVNDTYMKTWNAIPPQRPTTFSAFLGKIARNLSINKYKEYRAQKRGSYEIPILLEELEGCIPSANSIEAEYEAGILVKAIDHYLGLLDPENRIVFVRRYWYVDSISSIASRFQMSESKVKSMLFRTRNKLRIYLEKEGVSI